MGLRTRESIATKGDEHRVRFSVRDSARVSIRFSARVSVRVSVRDGVRDSVRDSVRDRGSRLGWAHKREHRDEGNEHRVEGRHLQGSASLSLAGRGPTVWCVASS